MRFTRLARILAIVVVAALSAASACAQGDDTTSVTGRWITPPSSATNITASFSSIDDSTQAVTASFPIPYFGRTYNSMYVSTNGFVLFGGTTANGCCSASAG